MYCTFYMDIKKRVKCFSTHLVWLRIWFVEQSFLASQLSFHNNFMFFYLTLFMLVFVVVGLSISWFSEIKTQRGQDRPDSCSN